jgi:hypothetical protein
MPRIIYDGNNIDVLIDGNSLRVTPEAENFVNRSSSGKIETVNLYRLDTYSFEGVCKADAERQLYTFFHSWFSQGKTWAFAMDKNKTASTTLDDAAAADQKTIPLTSTTGIKAGDTMILIPAAGTHREKIKVGKVNAGVSVVACDDLLFAYASGDACRYHEYFPTVKNTDKRFTVTQDGKYFFFTLNFIEAF